jgi:hypothetical protein
MSNKILLNSFTFYTLLNNIYVYSIKFIFCIILNIQKQFSIENVKKLIWFSLESP